MPSELRAVFGVLIFTPQAVKPSVLSATTWKFGELRRVRPARVKPFERRTTRIRGQVCCRSRTFAFLASSHHVRSWPRITAPPRPSIAPRPMTPLPGASSARRSGLQPGAALAHLGQDPAAAGLDVVVARVARAEERGVGVDHERDAGLQPQRAAQEDVRGAAARSSRTARPAGQASIAAWIRAVSGRASSASDRRPPGAVSRASSVAQAGGRPAR